MTKKPHILLFRDWYALYKDYLVLNLQEDECLACEGAGSTECGECGQDKNCPACAGEGVGFTGDEDGARRIYDEQLKQDLKKWNEWHEIVRQVAA